MRVDSTEQYQELSRQPLRGTGRNTHRVIRVNPDGRALIEVEVEPLVIRGSRHQDSMTPQKVTLNMTPLGEASSGKLARGKAVSARSLLLDPSALSRLGAVLPARAVNPGSRWTNTAPNPFQSSGTVSVTNRYFARDRVRGTPTARIHQTMNIPLGMRLSEAGGRGVVRVHGAIKVNTAIQFSPSLGKIVRSSTYGSGTVRLTPLEDKTGKDSAVVTLNVDVISELEQPD